MKRLIVGAMAIGTAYAANANAPLMKTISDDVLIGETSTKIITRNAYLESPSSARMNARMNASSTLKKGYVIYENFGGWNEKEKYWVPNGWSVEHRGECNKEYTWTPLKPTVYYPTIADGVYCYCISFDENLQDEWLISPEFTPEKNMLLSYYMRLYPIYFYDTKNLNHTTGDYDGGKNTLYTLQVLIKEEGEGNDWVLLRDYAEEYKDYNYKELRDACNGTNLEKQTVALDDYVGKSVKIAFRYLGSDGDLIMLDAIGVGYPTLDNVWYMEPTNSLYWGLSRSAAISGMPMDIAYYPANTPITWQNMSEEDATYSWRYMAKSGTKFEISNDQEELKVSYAAGKQGSTPRLYETPTLIAEAPERVDGNYRSPVSYFQAGGSPSYSEGNKEYKFTLFQYPVNYLDISFTSVRDDKLGAYSVPVFGYNEFSDAYWLDYSLNGEAPMEGNFSHLIGVGNVYFASSETPLIVNGMSIYGWGRVEDDAEFTATIYALDSKMHTDYDTFTVIARATIKGKDVEANLDKNSKDYLYLPFQFDEPVAVKASEEHPAFLFMLEGFHSEKVEYFAPLQSFHPNEISFPAGYILSEINLQGHIEDGTYRSLKRMQYMENGTYYSQAGIFAIGLDAAYPLDNEIPDAVSSIESENGNEAIYDLNGMKVSSASKAGIYIVKKSDGSVRKIIKH
ncbi:MAG: choice-of-anchor J domain-containing protein [Muribaculaceae bacterium]|nr:choice-of-anchor J domain-containing protein [Muribaculaceae bacterium]